MFHRERHHDGGFVPRLHSRVADREGFAVSNMSDEPRTLYVGNLDPAITDDFLSTLFNHVGVVTKTKIIYDMKTFTDPYAFIEFRDHHDAVKTMKVMQKRELLGKELRINWAADQQHGGERKQDSRHFHVFVGDLSTEIDNQKLREAFAPFGDVSEAKVIRDTQTNKSKGYGFVSFPKRDDAERAIEQMNGQWLGRRTIRTNWASRKPGDSQHDRERQERQERIWEQKFEELMTQSAPDNTSVYVGNISVLNDDDIRGAFDKYGRIIEVRLFKAAGYAFVKFEMKESAARAIVHMNNQEIKGIQVRCSWGKSGSSNENSFQEETFDERAGLGCGSGSGSDDGFVEFGQFPESQMTRGNECGSRSASSSASEEPRGVSSGYRYRSKTPAARSPPRAFGEFEMCSVPCGIRAENPENLARSRISRFENPDGNRAETPIGLGCGMSSGRPFRAQSCGKVMLRSRWEAETSGIPRGNPSAYLSASQKPVENRKTEATSSGSGSGKPSACPSASTSAPMSKLELAKRQVPALADPQIFKNWQNYWARVRAETDADRNLPRVPPWITARNAHRTIQVRAAHATQHERENDQYYGPDREMKYKWSHIKKD